MICNIIKNFYKKIFVHGVKIDVVNKLDIVFQMLSLTC